MGFVFFNAEVRGVLRRGSQRKREKREKRERMSQERV